MGWEITNVEEKRYNFILLVLDGSHTFKDACIEHGISRRVGYKWFNRFLESGYNGLKDVSKAPLNHAHQVSHEIVQQIIDIRKEHMHWGPKKIWVELDLMNPNGKIPSESFIGNVLKKYALSAARKTRQHVAKTAPLGSCLSPNDIWMYDFKGWFLTGNGEKCEPLTITDGYSRYLLKCKSLKSKTSNVVWDALEATFHEYGLPLRLRSDNGPPFATTSVGRLSPLAIKVIKAGVTPEWIEPGKPQQNGRHERFHQTLKKETAQPPAANLEAQEKRFEEFKLYFNKRRPHEALDQMPPTRVYKPSNRLWDGKFHSPEYEKCDVRKVQQTGNIRWKGKELFISKFLCGEPISLTEIAEDEREVKYGPIILGTILREEFKRI